MLGVLGNIAGLSLLPIVRMVAGIFARSWQSENPSPLQLAVSVGNYKVAVYCGLDIAASPG